MNSATNLAPFGNGGGIFSNGTLELRNTTVAGIRRPMGPEQGKNPFGRPIFQNLQCSDTPTQPLVQMRFTDLKAKAGQGHRYRVIAVNTVGLKSK